MRIVQLRKKRQMTQAELAKRCVTTQQQIAKIETGVVDPKLSTLRKIAEALDCELPDLFFSKRDFLSEIIQVVRELKLNLRKMDILTLNGICHTQSKLPPFHPFWERIVLENNSIRIKGDHS